MTEILLIKLDIKKKIILNFLLIQILISGPDETKLNLLRRN